MFFTNKNFVYYLSLICITFLPDAIKADEQTPSPANVAQVTNTLTANPQIETKISQDAEHFKTGLFSQNHPSVVALPDQIMPLHVHYDFTHFFPGVNYLSFQVPYCKILESSQNSPGIWLWILNQGST